MTHAEEHRGAQEHALLFAARLGDERAFGWLVEDHRLGLELYCRLMLGDPEAAKRAFAEVVLTAWRDRQNPQAQAAARIWLYRIAAHVCLEAVGD